MLSQVDNVAAASEKPMPPPENSKDLGMSEPPPDPGECESRDAQIADAGNLDGKAEPTPPIADGSSLQLTLFLSSVCYFFLKFYCFVA